MAYDGAAIFAGGSYLRLIRAGGRLKMVGEPMDQLRGDNTSESGDLRLAHLLNEALWKESVTDIEESCISVSKAAWKWLSKTVKQFNESGDTSMLPVAVGPGDIQPTTYAEALTVDLTRFSHDLQDELIHTIEEGSAGVEEMPGRDDAQSLATSYHPLAEQLCRPLLETINNKSHLLRSAALRGACHISDLLTRQYEFLSQDPATSDGLIGEATRYATAAYEMKRKADESTQGDEAVEAAMKQAATGTSASAALYAHMQQQPLALLRQVWNRLTQPKEADITQATLNYFQSLDTTAKVLNAACYWEGLEAEALLATEDMKAAAMLQDVLGDLVIPREDAYVTAEVVARMARIDEQLNVAAVRIADAEGQTKRR